MSGYKPEGDESIRDGWSTRFDHGINCVENRLLLLLRTACHGLLGKRLHPSYVYHARMTFYGPIVLIDDDKDDLEIMEDVLVQLGVGEGNVRKFSDCFSALKYLESTSEKPFLIICDINIPAMNGMEFKRILNQNDYLRRKSIPFVFFTSATISAQVIEAYEMTVQGFFTKRSSLAELEETLRRVIAYWQFCVHPNTVG